MLNGIRVIEIAPFYPGPFCTQILAEHGAEVIKVEPPAGDPMRFNEEMFAAINRNKKSVVLNLKEEKDLKAFFELVKRSDVIVEGFRPGVAKKLGIDYESVRRVNKKMIYCSISGFGQDSEFLDIPVHDINVLSMNGVCKITGLKVGKPADPNVQLADFSSAMFATIAILMAIIKREKTGEGEYIDVSMYDSSFAAVPLHTSRYLNGGGDLEDFISNPGYDIYKTKDGFVSLGMLNEPHFWKNLCVALKLERYIDLSYDERIKRYSEIRNEIEKRISKFSNKEIFELFRKSNLPFGVVKDVLEGSKLYEKRGFLAKSFYRREYTVATFPVVYKETELKRDGRAPEIGENNDLLEGWES
ncbi:CoA transferase [Archaeoglobales archaeon]|nr:MAG: CoA transferase [Archaeoglobales archaeon]